MLRAYNKSIENEELKEVKIKSSDFCLYGLLVSMFLLLSGTALLNHSYALLFIFLVTSSLLVFPVFHNGPKLLMLAAIINLLLLTYYMPVYGMVLSFLGEVDQRSLRAAVGIRPLVFSILLCCFCLIVFYKERKTRSVVLFTALFFMISFFSSDAELIAKVAYVSNSFVPYFTLLFLFYVYKMNDGFGIRVVNSPPLLVIMFFAIVVGGLLINYIYYEAYDWFRPDLLTSIRTRDGAPLPYGEYPSYWQSVFYSFRLVRISASFPDAIVFGYVMAFFAFYFYWRRSFFLLFIGLVLLAITLSKGALAFFIQAVVLNFAMRMSTVLFYTISGMFLIAQVMLSGVLDTSASVHLEGLVGAFSSIYHGNLFNYFFGYGLGEGGNLDRLVNFGREERSIWLSTGSESGVGVITYQLGGIGLMLASYLLFSKANMLKKSNNMSSSFVYPSVFSLSINAFLQETVINASISGILIFFILMVESGRKKTIEYPKYITKAD